MMLSLRQEPGVFVPDGVPYVSLAPGVPPPPDKGCLPGECVFPGVPVVFVTVGLALAVGVVVPGMSVGSGVPVVTVGDSVTVEVAVMVGVTTGVEVTVGVTMGVGVTGRLVGVTTGVGGVVGVAVTVVGMTVGITGDVGVGTGVFVATGNGVGRCTGVLVTTGVGVCCGYACPRVGVGLARRLAEVVAPADGEVNAVAVPVTRHCPGMLIPLVVAVAVGEYVPATVGVLA